MNKYRVETKRARMSSRTQVRLSVVAIILLTAFFSLIAWPTLPKGFPGSAFFNKFYPHLGLDLQGGTHLVYEANLSQVAAKDQDSALEGARDVIERRVNSIGVSEPIVQITKQSGHSRIIIELAGVQDVNQAIKLIGETPLLEFKEVGAPLPTTATSTPNGAQISEVEKKNKAQEQLAKDLIARINKGEKFEDLAKQYSDDTANKAQGGDLGWVKKGVFTPLFEKVIFEDLKPGQLRQTPLLTEFGYHIIKKLEERTAADGSTEVHSEHILLRTETVATTGTGQNVNWVNTQLSGRQLKSAAVTFQGQSNEPQVSITFNSEGEKLFKDLTEKNLNKPIGIFLDGVAISAPTVQSVISGGQAVITGNFSLEEAKVLAQRLNAGALPVPVSLISQQTVGATLGNDSLQKSLFAGFVGLCAVALFMIGYYILPGLMAILALLIYSVLALGIFELIPVTLTLAGIAGFVLSIGMAVDANILIFERTKEELRRGLGFVEAVEEGFSRAFPSIRDSNMSSLITCAILYWFGSSIIRGFAVTLAIGIIISLFSAITVTRTFLRLIVHRKFVHKYWLFGIRKKHV